MTGPAPEHLCFWHPESRTLLSGDLVAGEGSIMISPPEGDLREYVASLERARELTPLAHPPRARAAQS
ncbi:MAG TPA: MBL fold metallo-hydrolase [Rubrobacteraceae bacterium]|nr:MBL fold metallo-hydrolase [Rubrobacteraceae bacterium]